MSMIYPRNIHSGSSVSIRRDCQLTRNHLKAMTHAENIRRSPNAKLTKEAVSHHPGLFRLELMNWQSASESTEGHIPNW
jgi:hypothetical protein